MMEAGAVAAPRAIYSVLVPTPTSKFNRQLLLAHFYLRHFFLIISSSDFLVNNNYSVECQSKQIMYVLFMKSIGESRYVTLFMHIS